MATTRPEKIDLFKQGDESEKKQLHRSGPQPQFSVSGGDTGTLSPTTKPVKPVKLSVYTMSKEMNCPEMVFSSGRLTTAKQILHKVLSNFGIPQSDWKAFSLWLRSKHLQLQLKPYHLPCKLYKRWKDLLSQYTSITYEEVCGDEPLLYIQRNAFLTLQDEKALLEPHDAHQKTIDLLYHEAVHNVIKNPYPVTREELHHLAGLQAAALWAKTGTTPILHQNNLCNFYPTYMYAETRSLTSKLFSSKPNPLRHIQEEFSVSLRSTYAACDRENQLKVSYLQKCWEHTAYGSVLFKGQIKKVPKAVHKLYYQDRQVYVAINMESVHILSASSPTEILLFKPLDQLCWEFKSCEAEGEDFFSSLWLEYEEERQDLKKVFKLLQVFSRQARMMDAMLCRCVGDLSLDVQAQGQRSSPPAAGVVKPKVVVQQHKLQCEEYSEDGQCLKQSSESTLTRIKKKRSQSPTGEEHSMWELRTKSNAALIEGKTTSI